MPAQEIGHSLCTFVLCVCVCVYLLRKGVATQVEDYINSQEALLNWRR